MEGHHRLKNFIQKFNLLTEDETSQFVQVFKEVRVKKRQFIVQPNFVANTRHYVVEGSFRSFVVGANGNEHTISFAIEDWWITDYNSYIFQKPATMYVVALEDSVILQIDFDQEQRLKKNNHKFETIFRIMAERGLAFQQRQLISNLTQSAEERYNQFLKNYPKIAQRLPQYVLASFLGMTTEFLSKIRNHKIKSK